MAASVRPAARRPRWIAVAIVLLGVLAAACNPMAGFGTTIQRNGTILRVSMPGRGEADARGWLCPGDPGPGEKWSKAGMVRLDAAGCLDLGLNATPAGEAPAYTGTFDLANVDTARIRAFAAIPTWMLIVVTGGQGFEHVSTTQIPAIALPS